MEEAKKFYIKFKMNTERHIMENMIVSENRSTIDEWKGIHSEGHESEHDEEEEEEKPPGYPFQKAERDFELSINTFQTAVPFMMSALPVLRRVVDDMNIRKFVEKQATRLEAGEFELYQISLDHRSAILRKLQQSTAILTGINAIPDVFLMGLISAYDSFLADLIRCIFVERPELLSSSERNISFKDLMEIGSVEAARERIIEKEVETVIRDSHVQQIEWLEKKLSMPLRKDLKIWPQFVEICERRNLISHTDGVVSSQYLAVCKEHGVTTNGAAVGSRLEITAEYYRKAVSVILEFGTKLAQVIWRKLVPDQIEQADRELNELSYRLITKRRYREAIVLLRFGLYEMKKHGTDATKKAMVVNLANAEKLDGNKDEAEKILSNEDWSASTDRFNICVAAVRDDTQTVVKLMKPVVDANLLNISDLRDWPVFENLRSDPAFIETFEREFGQKIVTDRETPIPSPSGEPSIAEEEDEATPQTAPEGKTVH